jgi:segregation and condensation protein B
MNLESQIEAVLFYKAEPIAYTFLAKFFAVPESDILTALSTLDSTLLNRGITIVRTDTHVHMVTAPAVSERIESMRKEEMKQDIGKAGAETLAIILYRGPLSRVEVDRIRGVNSAFIIRNLLIRGLVERRANPTDTRSFVYAATPALFAHLGIQKREDLPDFSVIMNTLDTFERQENEQTSTENLTVE